MRMIAFISAEITVQAQIFVKVIHYVYPSLAFLYYFISLAFTACTLNRQKLRFQGHSVQKRFITGWTFVIAFTYMAEAITCGIQGMVMGIYSDQDHIVYTISSTINFAAQALVLFDSPDPIWRPYFVTWLMGLFVELILLITQSIFYIFDKTFNAVFLTEQIARASSFIVIISLYHCLRKDQRAYLNEDTERQSLLRNKLDLQTNDSESSFERDYGTNPRTCHKSHNIKKTIRREQTENWFADIKKLKLLHLRMILVLFCLLGSSALSVLVPSQIGILIDSLTICAQGNHNCYIWLPLVTYITLYFISSNFISWFRQWLWNPIEQHSYNSLSTSCHSHIMSLSSDFYDSKTSSDLKQLILGSRSVNILINTLLFQLVPMLLDLAFAFCYLASQFGPYACLILFATLFSYLHSTSKLHGYRDKNRQDYKKMSKEEINTGLESIDNWYTAKIFDMISSERDRYACTIKDHLYSKHHYEISSQLMDVTQGLIVVIGFLFILWLGVYQVAHGGKSIGQFTALLIYWVQLSCPLVLFSSLHKPIMNGMISSEHLIELFNTKPTVTDLPESKPLNLVDGLVMFKNVSFSYDHRIPTLNNISFAALPGKVVALVGETGGGKSTILKLIHRFYDVDTGSISIDGQDIRGITLSSLREKIGIVPQELQFFNDSILNNLRYAKSSVSNQEIYDACKALSLHEKILNFPDGYNSKFEDISVEKHRLAIARTILKKPNIVLLDEANFVETESEHSNHKSLFNLFQGRTTLIVAHKLSTIMDVDLILVVMNGEIVEVGSHANLLLRNGKYKEIWSRQNVGTFSAGYSSNLHNYDSTEGHLKGINVGKSLNQRTESMKNLETDEHLDLGTKYENISDENKNTNICKGIKAQEEKIQCSNRSSVEPFEVRGFTQNFSEYPSSPNSLEIYCHNEAFDREWCKISELPKNDRLIPRQDQYIRPGKGTVNKAPTAKLIEKSKHSIKGMSVNESNTNTRPKMSTPVRLQTRKFLAKTEPPTCTNRHCQSSIRTTGSVRNYPLLKNVASIRRHVSDSDGRISSQKSHVDLNRRNRQWKLKNQISDQALSTNSSQLSLKDSSFSIDNS